MRSVCDLHVLTVCSAYDTNATHDRNRRKPGLRVFGGLAIPNVSEMLKDLQSFFVTALLFLIPVEVLVREYWR